MAGLLVGAHGLAGEPSTAASHLTFYVDLLTASTS